MPTDYSYKLKYTPGPFSDEKIEKKILLPQHRKIEQRKENNMDNLSLNNRIKKAFITNKSDKGFWIGPCLFGALVIGILYFNWHYSVSTVREEIITVKKKEAYKEKLMVFCEEGEYRISDNIFLGVFNAASTYNKIEEGKKYKAKVNWFRKNFPTMYPNILEIKEEIPHVPNSGN